MKISYVQIILLFYFGYWIAWNTTPFSFWWLIGFIIIGHILESLVASFLKIGMKKYIKDFEKRAKDLEEKLKSLEEGSKIWENMK